MCLAHAPLHLVCLRRVAVASGRSVFGGGSLGRLGLGRGGVWPGARQLLGALAAEVAAGAGQEEAVGVAALPAG